jgi:hypothetical protein
MGLCGRGARGGGVSGVNHRLKEELFSPVPAREGNATVQHDGVKAAWL